MSGAVEVGLLGPVLVRVDGTMRSVPGVPQRTLLTRLALSAGRQVPAPQLLEVLWGDRPPANAVGNLHSYVSRLRRIVGSDRVIREASGYRLTIARSDVDLGLAEDLVAEARAVRNDDPAHSSDCFTRALALWRGEPLGDLPDLLPFAPQLAWLTEWRMQLVEERLGLLLDTGQTATALPELERAAADAPLREGVVVLLMRGLHQSGRTAEALDAARRYRRQLADDTGLDAGAALADVERRVLAQDPELRARWHEAATERVGVRRTPLDRFIGRDRDLAAVASALASHRLVTVVGPGGIGKTRLALEHLDARDDHEQVFVVRLTDVTTAEDVTATVAGALGLQAAPQGLRTAIADRLGGDAALVLLDNCEHVAASVRTLVVELLGRCPRIRLLATSRHRLDVPGERVLRLGPLEPADQVELFCDRASLLRTRFDPTDRTSMVADICRLVDGIPLAVELAARREAVFGVAQLHARLAAGLDVLDPAGSGDRSTAIEATVEWSYRLLDQNAQALFDRLAVCRGGFGVGALDQLAPADAANPAALLAELVEASLVVPDLRTDAPRYRILEPMRQVALGHLTAAGLRAARDAHVQWMRELARELWQLLYARSPRAFTLLREEATNLRDALEWLTEIADDDAAADLAMTIAVAVADAPNLELHQQLLRIHADSTASTEAGLRCVAAGVTAWMGGDAEIADRWLADAVATLPDSHPRRWVAQFFRLLNSMYLGDPSVVAHHCELLSADPQTPAWAHATGVCCAALTHSFAGNPAAAAAWVSRHDDLLATVGPGDSFIAYTRGELAAADDPHAALGWFDTALAQATADGHTYNQQIARIGAVAVRIRLGHHDSALATCRELLDDLRRLGMWAQVWTTVRLTAELLVDLNDAHHAAVLLSAADRDPLAPAVVGPDARRRTQLWATITGQLGPDRVAAARAEQRARSRSDALHDAIAALDRHA